MLSSWGTEVLLNETKHIAVAMMTACTEDRPLIFVFRQHLKALSSSGTKNSIQTVVAMMKRANRLAERLKEPQKAKAALDAIDFDGPFVHYLEAFTKPAVSDVLKLDMNLVGMPGDVSELRTGADKELRNAIHGIDVRRIDIQRPIFDETDDRAVRNALGVDASCHWTFQEWHDQYHDIRQRYAINVFCHGSYILCEDVPPFIQEVEAFNADLQDLRRRVCAVLESRGHAHRLVLRFNPRVRYGVYVLTARQDSDEFFRRMKERAIDKFLARKRR